MGPDNAGMSAIIKRPFHSSVGVVNEISVSMFHSVCIKVLLNPSYKKLYSAAIL